MKEIGGTPFLRAGLLWLGAVILAAGSAVASQLIPRSLPELVEGATLIFVGRCESVECHWNKDHSLILTANRFQVLRSLKGAFGSTITLKELGGIVGHTALHVSDVPRFRVGEEALLCVHRTELGRWVTFGAMQGKFEVIRDARGRPWVRSDFYRQDLASMSPVGRHGGRAPLAVFAGQIQTVLNSRRISR